ncbi:MAG TPA: hypothetical protein VGQ20_15020, partial [Acidimicrobiales bacterium]|nr:hypothetical protein [Acidimicrobiales bacterium]
MTVAAPIVVVHTGRLAAGAPDPRDRQVLRRVLDLAAGYRGRVVLAVTEPARGSTTSVELDAAGVRVVETVGRLRAWLAASACDAAAIVATDIELADRVREVVSSVPLILDVAGLPSLEYERTRSNRDRLELPGFETVARRFEQRDAAVLGHAALVLCIDDAIATAAAPRGAGTRARVLRPSVPCEPPREPLSPAGAIAFVGRFATEAGLPDERALAHLVQHLDAPMRAVGLDVALTRRMARGSVATTHGPQHLDHIVRSSRVAVVAAARRATLAELSGMGVPVVAFDELPDAAALDAIRRLLVDDESWRAAQRDQLAYARDRHDPARQRAELAAALAMVGIKLDGG